MTYALRPYQQQGVDDARNLIELGFSRILRQLPTGGGKTVEIGFIANNAVDLGHRVLIVAHRFRLVMQALGHVGHQHDVGIIKAGVTPNVHAPIQIAMVQSLAKRAPRYQPFDVIIIDECHHATAGQYKQLYELYPNAIFIGYTATPCRTDDSGLGNVFQEMILGPQIGELIAAGYLKQPEVYQPSIIDTSGVRASADYNRKELEAAADKSIITGDAIKHYSRYCAGEPALAGCVSVLHAQHVAEQFRAEGYRAVAIHGETPQDEQDAALNGLETGEVHVVTYCDLIGEGVDVPCVAVAIDLAPTKSLTRAMQRWGRALRKHPRFTAATILDHAGNTLLHGLPDDNREWTLDKGEVSRRKNKQRDSLQIYTCSECYHVHLKSPACPRCGHVYVVGRELEHVDADLVRVEREQEQARFEKRKEDLRSIVPVTQTLEELEDIELELEYKPGWALHQWQAQGNRMSNAEISAYYHRAAERRGYSPGWVTRRLQLAVGG